MKHLIILAFVLFISCTRQQIKISAVNPATGEPYPGLHYTISKNTTGAFETHSHKVKEGTLNDKGVALVSLNLSHYRSYVIGLESPGEFCYTNNTSYTFSYTDKPFDFVFEIVPCAYLQQDIVNVNCEGATDTFSIRDKYTYTDWTGWTDLAGCFSNTGGGYSKVPAGTRIFQWKVVRTSGTTMGSDTIVFAEGTYETLTIHY